jgi:hypothetical protein
VRSDNRENDGSPPIEYYTYRPKSDFLVLKAGFPRLLAEVGSISRSWHKEDRTRMLLQGSAVVRFANEFLDAFKSKKDFVLVAMYFHGVGMLDLYYLFQVEGTSEVCHASYISLHADSS